MVQRVRRFSVGQTAKVFGVLYGILGLVFLPFIVLAVLFAPDQAGFGIGVAVLFPIMYGIIGFIMTAICCLLYNLVASMVGGVELELDG